MLEIKNKFIKIRNETIKNKKRMCQKQEINVLKMWRECIKTRKKELETKKFIKNK